MSLFVNFRSHPHGGSVRDAQVLEGDGSARPIALVALTQAAVAARVADKDVVFGIHGFNVNLEEGATSLGQFEGQLGLGANDVYFGVLWPGDSWLPVVNYPFEGTVAMDCGGRLATLCKTALAAARSFAFVTHSLGARVGLECTRQLDRPARVLCLTAAAINRDSLTAQYQGATSNATTIALLASHGDMVLKFAFAIGDPISEALYDDHRAFQKALGYDGPPTPAPATVRSPWQIPDGGPTGGYGHHDYLPPSDRVDDVATGPRWVRVAAYAGQALRGEAGPWP